jgi:hypothetical protein
MEDFVQGLTATTVGVYFPKSFDVCMVGLRYLMGTRGVLITSTDYTFENKLDFAI